MAAYILAIATTEMNIYPFSWAYIEFDKTTIGHEIQNA